MRPRRSPLLARVALAATFCVFLALPAGGLARPTPTKAANIGLPPFGVALSSNPDDKAGAWAGDVRAGFASVLFSWSELQPTEGAWDVDAQTRLDRRILDLAASPGGLRRGRSV